MKKLIAIFLVLLCNLTMAQYRYFYPSVDLNKPLSNTSWISDGTARGARLGYRVFLNEKFSVGLDLHATTYDQYKPTETMQQSSGALTTDYFNYVYNYGAAVSGQHYFKVGEGDTFLPYVGVGVGANHNEYVMYYNIYKERDNRWGFLARPEAGILVKFGGRRSLGALAAIHYDYSTNSSKKFGYNGFSNIGFNFGIVLIEW
jgi:hypothetical protein